jgi:hypothetical protein
MGKSDKNKISSEKKVPKGKPIRSAIHEPMLFGFLGFISLMSYNFCKVRKQKVSK